MNQILPIAVILAHDPCSEQRQLLLGTFPSGVPLTKEGLKRAREAGLDLEWTECLLDQVAWAAYKAATANAIVPYQAVQATAWAAYKAATANAIVPYQAVQATAWAAYKAATANAIVHCKAVQATAWAAYKAATAVASATYEEEKAYSLLRGLQSTYANL